MHAPGHLPPELYSHIFSHISSGSDISAVARTCTIFRDLATPFLYHTIRPDCVEPERLKQLLARIAESPRAASSVRILDLTWQLETDIFDSAHPPTDAALRSIASRATPALNSMCNLTTLLLAHDIDKAADLLERCTLPSLKALQASFSSPVHAFLERHPRVTALELLPSLQRAASTFPAGDPLVYLGGTCGLIAQALAPSSARELSNLAILHIRRGYPLQPLAFHALDAWHKRTGRRLQYLLFSNVATDYDGLMPGSFLPVEVERVVLVGIALDESTLVRLGAFLRHCQGVHTLHISHLQVVEVESPTFREICDRFSAVRPTLHTIVAPSGRAWKPRNGAWHEGDAVGRPLPSPFFLREEQQYARRSRSAS